MIAGIMAAGAAIVLLVFAIVATRDLARGRRALVAPGRHRTGDLLVALVNPAGPTPPLIRSLAVAASEGPIAVHWCIHPEDTQTPERIVEAQQRLPRADLRIRPTVVESRQVAATAMVIQALADTGNGAIAVVDEAARPSSRDPGAVLAALGESDALDLVGTCPAPSSGMEPGEALAARGLCDHTPLLFAVHGPEGLWPLLVAAPRDAWDRAVTRPLAGNFPSPAALLSTVSTRQSACLLPVAIGVEPGSVRRLRRRHLQWLAHRSRGRIVLTAICLAAMPGTLAAAALAPAGAAATISWTAFAVAALARGVISFTWTRTVLGTGPAVQAWVLSPWRDLRTLASLILAAAIRDTRLGGTRYRIASGGILAPAAPDDTSTRPS